MAQKDIQPYSFEPIPRKKPTNDQDDRSSSSSSNDDAPFSQGQYGDLAAGPML